MSECCLLMASLRVVIPCAVFTYRVYTNILFTSSDYASLDNDNDAVTMETAVCIALRRQRGRTA